jgi:C-methyltransferase C-terminal domain
VLLAARRDADDHGAPDDQGAPDKTVRALLAAEAQAGVRDPAVLAGLQDDVEAGAGALHDWLARQAAAGRTVLGYGAASRAVALLRTAGVDRSLLPAVADASAAKQGRRMPGTAIPVISPAELIERHPDEVAVFVSDLMAEVRAAYPEIEANGGRWADADTLGARAGSDGPGSDGPGSDRQSADQDASSSTRSRARQRPLVGPMLPTGTPSSSDISA